MRPRYDPQHVLGLFDAHIPLDIGKTHQGKTQQQHEYDDGQNRQGHAQQCAHGPTHLMSSHRSCHTQR